MTRPCARAIAATYFGISFLVIVVSVGVLSAPGEVSALQITPAIIRRDVQPGETQSVVVAVRNELSVSVKLSAEILGVSIDRQRNAPTVLDDDQNIFHSARSWLKAPEILPIIQAGATEWVTFGITAPPQAEPGGWSAAIAFTARPTTAPEEQAINISSRVVSILLLSVPGEVIIKERIVEFKTDKKWYASLPVHFYVVYENEGTVHRTPLASIIIHDWSGRERAMPLMNPKVLTVFPKTTRTFDIFWNGDEGGQTTAGTNNRWNVLGSLRLWGKMRAEVTVGPPNDAQTATISFWIISPGPLAFVALLMVGAVLWYRRRLRALRHNNKSTL